MLAGEECRGNTFPVATQEMQVQRPDLCFPIWKTIDDFLRQNAHVLYWLRGVRGDDHFDVRLCDPQELREDAEALQQNLDTARAQNEQLESQKNSLDSQLNAELEIARQEASKLATEREELLAQNLLIQRELDQLRQKERTNTAAVESTQANNEKLTAEVSVLRKDIRSEQQARDEAFDVTIAATDDLHQSQGEVTALRDRNSQLVRELGDKTALLEDNGIDPHTSPDAVVPQVRGIISKSQRTAGSQLIEVTVGADDGLKPGHTVEVFRGDRYLGRAEILKTEPDRAVGRVLRQFQQGQIQEGDDVATRFRIS